MLNSTSTARLHCDAGQLLLIARPGQLPANYAPLIIMLNMMDCYAGVMDCWSAGVQSNRNGNAETENEKMRERRRQGGDWRGSLIRYWCVAAPSSVECIEV